MIALLCRKLETGLRDLRARDGVTILRFQDMTGRGVLKQHGVEMEFQLVDHRVRLEGMTFDSYLELHAVDRELAIRTKAHVRR